MNKVIELPAIKETTTDYEALEKYIRLFFAREIYGPLLREFRPKDQLRNAKDRGLLEALRTGAVTFNRGVFSGKFDSVISLDLRNLGAKFHRTTGTYRLSLRHLPYDIRIAIGSSAARFKDKIEAIDKKLGDVVTEEFLGKGISAKLKTDHFFDRALWKVETAFRDNVKNIAIVPTLTDEQRKRIAAEWGQNMQLWISDFTKKEITELRANMQNLVFAGDRYGSAVKTIQESYGVTGNKAKFLARQETGLLMAKYKQTRYQAAGVEYYRWTCVAGTKNHPVRPMHKALNGKVFRFDDPPVVDIKGARKNPGQDYNCRCFPRPLVNYRGPTG